MSSYGDPEEDMRVIQLEKAIGERNLAIERLNAIVDELRAENIRMRGEAAKAQNAVTRQKENFARILEQRNELLDLASRIHHMCEIWIGDEE